MPAAATFAAVATKCCASAQILTPAQLQKPEQCEEKAMVVQPQTDAQNGKSDDSGRTLKQVLRRQAELEAMVVGYCHKWLDRSIGSTATAPQPGASTPAAAALQQAKASLLSAQQAVRVKASVSAVSDAALGKEVDIQEDVLGSNEATTNAMALVWKMASPYNVSSSSVFPGTAQSALQDAHAASDPAAAVDESSAPAQAAQPVQLPATPAEANTPYGTPAVVAVTADPVKVPAAVASLSAPAQPEHVQPATTEAPDAAEFATEICELLIQELEHTAESGASTGNSMASSSIPSRSSSSSSSSVPSRSNSGISSSNPSRCSSSGVSIGSGTGSLSVSGGGDSCFSVAVDSSQLDIKSSFGSNSSSMPDVHSNSPGSSDQDGTETGKHVTLPATSSRAAAGRSKSKACIDAALSGSEALEQPVPLNPLDNNTMQKYDQASSSMWSHTCGPPVQTRTACWENARHIDSAANPAAAAASSRWGACNCRVVLTRSASWVLSTQQQQQQDEGQQVQEGSLEVMLKQQHNCLHFSKCHPAALHNAFERYVQEWIQQEGEGEDVVEAGPPRGIWRPEAVAARAAAAAAAAAVSAAAAAAANAQSGAAAVALAGKAASSGASKRRRSQGPKAASANNRCRS
jgi:hypothetical protein